MAQLRGRAARLAQLLPAGPASAARTPFVVLIVALLGGGLIVLLVLNSALNEGSFQLSKLKRETTELTDEQQQLKTEVDGHAAPDALERRARELGMVPGGPPAFLGPDGKVHGEPREATAPPKPKKSPKATDPADSTDSTDSVDPADPDSAREASPTGSADEASGSPAAEESAGAARPEGAESADGADASTAPGSRSSASTASSPSPSTTPGR
ncbi:septum formation initiator [Streptomyces sp. KLOTTS4A1]|uniref:septum formation initiator n=1 Tax=Streptomyces sp. KLOTTS4A1 TaxID=3390996 RepID=UPI0039F530DE